MIIPMDRKIFDSLAVEAVGHACFEPMVPVYQDAMRRRCNRTEQEVRGEFYKSLSQGQRALFLFFSYYDHAIQSIDEFQRISGYYLTAQIFTAVKKSAEYFCDDEMLHLLVLIEQTILNNEGENISELYHRFREISSHTLAVIGACIKQNPAEFVCFEWKGANGEDWEQRMTALHLV